jgi:acetylornithine deacetylase
MHYTPVMQADPRSIDMIRTLVSYDTTSRESNLGLIDWVRDYLDGLGMASHLTFDDDQRKGTSNNALLPED